MELISPQTKSLRNNFYKEAKTYDDEEIDNNG